MIKSNIAKDESFGIIPILLTNNSYQFLLIQHQAGHWGFPKGHAHPHESPLEAASRELSEETGITDYQLLGNVSFSENYTFTRKGKTFDKTVLYFPALVQSDTVKFQEEEIQNYSWSVYEDAIARMTYEPSKKVLAEVHQYLLANYPHHQGESQGK